MNLEALRHHFAHHRSHFAACGLAIVLVIAAAVLGAPILAVLGTVLCGGMMVMMVWMMVRHGGH